MGLSEDGLRIDKSEIEKTIARGTKEEREKLILDLDRKYQEFDSEERELKSQLQLMEIKKQNALEALGYVVITVNKRRAIATKELVFSNGDRNVVVTISQENHLDDYEYEYKSSQKTDLDYPRNL